MNRIIHEQRGINRVGYDISAKPPATIEWGQVGRLAVMSVKYARKALAQKGK